jgi:hypothetical protein
LEADGEGSGAGNEGNNSQGGGSQGNTTPEGKTYSQDYVSAIRDEAKSHRLNAKHYETKLREVLGMSPDSDLTKVDELIKGYKETSQKQIAEAITKANARLLTAEIKALGADYDTKLVERLLDKSKLTVEESGEVKGLKEAIAELEKEFPTIKKASQQTSSGTNPAGAGITELQKLEAEYKAAMTAGNMPLAIAIKNQILKPKS